MGFKNLTKYVSTCCEFYAVWQLVPQPGSCGLKGMFDSSRKLLEWFQSLLDQPFQRVSLLPGIPDDLVSGSLRTMVKAAIWC